ncbi:MAG: esterase-like activity of phytase family protein [Acidobacteriota bacterium]
MRMWVAVVTMGLAIWSGRGVRADGSTLIGWATMPVDTFADGPTSGHFARSQFGHTLPIENRQVVQGFSGVITGPAAGTYYVTMDNGFGGKANSADSLLRVFAVRPDFRTKSGGAATVSAVDFRRGTPLPSFTPDSYITLRDPDRRLGFPLVADAEFYPGTPGNIPVAPEIRRDRLLTGADLDPESLRRDRDGHFWFGDEFGPFLVETDASGRVLQAARPLPGVLAPENPFRGTTPANLGGSRGFEGLAINRAGTTLFGLIEGTVTGDTARTLRIHEFDIAQAAFTGVSYGYSLDPLGTNIGDMTAVTDRQFLVIERNDAAGVGATPAPFKKIFLVDVTQLGADRIAKKTEIVDLMNVADPDDLNRDGDTTFRFPFVTIEDVLVVDRQTLLVINDNNYPGGGGRGAFSDPTEVLLIRLAAPLPSRP